MENDLKQRSRAFSTDLSPEAVARRLDIAGDLHEAAQWLRRFRPLPTPGERTNVPGGDPSKQATATAQGGEGGEGGEGGSVRKAD